VEGYFHGRVAAMLKGLGKIAIGWEEVAAVGGAPGAAIQAWRTSNGTALAVRAGHDTIVSAGYYLDLLTTAERLYAVDPFDLQADGFSPEEGEAARQAGRMAARFVEPLVLQPLPPLQPDEEARVLGGEGALWSELADAEMLDGRLWPRAAALAERFWSDASHRDPDDMYRRLAVVQDQLRRLGLQDLANRQRMAASLAPGRAEPVLAFLDLVAPVRHAAHNQAILAALRGARYATAQVLTDLADAAGADSLTARRFEAASRRFIGGDFDLAPALSAELQGWLSGQALFAEAAKGRPALEAALPVSALIAALAEGALAAVKALAEGRPMAPSALARANEAVAEAEAQEAASARPIFAFMRRQPPADLIVAVTAGVKTLVGAASALQPQARA
ncbi:MAG: family 20 glycosylhydrolase, partial [Caulobacteraceae bacterium]